MIPELVFAGVYKIITVLGDSMVIVDGSEQAVAASNFEPSKNTIVHNILKEL